ncbi:vWA domain-containing protein [Pelagicoccus mobilis]|uniref:VWA domain-containing protein n=1 Tax=Pelagicoccus mobilis TaxID=415221 RepID=A0A934RW68_9BACT|nr:VWA domain-containing protein [Pelagicoccus mobilis]MBK1877483.1 VWA domain-containing protein [Pelagicoccus mobilis]
MSTFVFQWPVMLTLLLGVAPMLWLMRRARVKRMEVRDEWGHGKMAPKSTKREIFWILCFVTLAVALARPSYDPVRHSISNTGRDVVFVVDVSRSMLARDTYPSRLEAAKQGVEDCLATLGSEQVGLVIYGGSSSISCPLSSDYEFVRYMLSQVQPRSVEFGGTFLLSAIEKVVDQVLDTDRKGFQDVIVLTDGEDHAPNLDKVVERVRESGVNLLVVGLGNPSEGAPIPLEKEDGTTTALTYEGETVYTQQQRDALASLAGKSEGSEYFNAGVQPFHLGDVYRRFAEGKPTASLDGDSGYTVYKEGAFWLLPLALLFAVLAHPSYWRGAMRLSLLTLSVLSMDSQSVRAQEPEYSFDSASALLKSEQFEEASLAFQSLQLSGGAPDEVAVYSFNKGLADWRRSQSVKDESPRDALSMALQARESFLLAARERPDFRRAKLRLSNLASTIVELRRAVEEEEEREQEQDDQMQSLLELLQALLEAQTDLRNECVLADPGRSQKRRSKSASAEEGSLEPSDAVALSKSFSDRQRDLTAEGKRIEALMKDLDASLSANASSQGPVVDSVLAVPLVLMGQAISAQFDAQDLLAVWANWATGRSRQETAEQRIQDILDMFASSDSEEGDEGDWEDYEDYEYGEEGEGMPSSMPMEGDLKKNAQMQALPVPNYSAEEILMEEMGSQQFRQEQRAKANAGKVKKDW